MFWYCFYIIGINNWDVWGIGVVMINIDFLLIFVFWNICVVIGIFFFIY